MNFGELIRSKGYTAKRLAEESGVSVRTIEEYAINHRSIKKCAADRFMLFAKILEVTPEELISIDD